MNPDAKELIKKAFDMARNSGKADWNRMTIAVLKNRLLALTGGAFNELDHGAKNMFEFVHKASDILNIDETHVPAVVELKQANVANEPSAVHSVGYDRIRPDLWRAIMDYASGNKYVWDADRGLARPQERDDPPELLLPTNTLDEEAKWREDFVSHVDKAVDEPAMGRLLAFAGGGISPKVLPPPLQARWFEFVKGQILKKLADWFHQHGLTPPDRLLVSVRRPARIGGTEDDVEQLRELIISCVRVMTASELLAVTLPPAAVLRVRR